MDLGHREAQLTDTIVRTREITKIDEARSVSTSSEPTPLLRRSLRFDFCKHPRTNGVQDVLCHVEHSCRRSIIQARWFVRCSGSHERTVRPPRVHARGITRAVLGTTPWGVRREIEVALANSLT